MTNAITLLVRQFARTIPVLAPNAAIKQIYHDFGEVPGGETLTQGAPPRWQARHLPSSPRPAVGGRVRNNVGGRVRNNVDADVRRLEALGATRRDHQQERGYDFWVLRDTWANEFPDLLGQRATWPD